MLMHYCGPREGEEGLIEIFSQAAVSSLTPIGSSFLPASGFNLPARRNLSACSLWRKHLFSHPVRSSFLPWIPSKTLFSRICATQFNVFAGKPDYNALR